MSVGVMGLFEEQVSSDIYLLDVFYLLAGVCLMLLVMALGLVDGGLVRRKNLLDTWIQKLVAALLSGGAFLVIGYGIWNWQFFQALGIPNAFGESIKAWWLGGGNLTAFAHDLDPAITPQADVYQVFAMFFVAYAMVLAALIHSAGIERVKAAPLYIIAIVLGGIAMPFETYLTWGSGSFLTNNGVHDYMGVFSGYTFVGVWALILAWRAGPRLGAFAAHARTRGPIPSNIGMTASGVALVLFAVPFLGLGCGYIVPGMGYFGISMATSGLGLVAVNIAAAYVGGIIGGALISYRTKNALFVLIGPIAGYVGCAGCMDVIKPWIALIIAFFAPFAFLFAYNLLLRLRIDEKKIVPLGLGCGIYGAVVSGFVAWGTKTGGFFGITEGKYAFQNAEITPLWQLAGLGVTIGTAAISGLILIIGLEKTIGLRVKEADEIEGLDAVMWQAPPEPDIDIPELETSRVMAGSRG